MDSLKSCHSAGDGRHLACWDPAGQAVEQNMNVLHAGSEEGEGREEGVWSPVVICQPTNRGGSLGDAGARQWCSCCMWACCNVILLFITGFTHHFAFIRSIFQRRAGTPTY